MQAEGNQDAKFISTCVILMLTLEQSSVVLIQSEVCSSHAASLWCSLYCPDTLAALLVCIILKQGIAVRFVALVPTTLSLGGGQLDRSRYNT
jgi:hypothetical protein